MLRQHESEHNMDAPRSIALAWSTICIDGLAPCVATPTFYCPAQSEHAFNWSTKAHLGVGARRKVADCLDQISSHADNERAEPLNKRELFPKNDNSLAYNTKTVR